MNRWFWVSSCLVWESRTSHGKQHVTHRHKHTSKEAGYSDKKNNVWEWKGTQEITRYKSLTDADIIFGELLLAVKVTEEFTPATRAGSGFTGLTAYGSLQDRLTLWQVCIRGCYSDVVQQGSCKVRFFRVSSCLTCVFNLYSTVFKSGRLKVFLMFA